MAMFSYVFKVVIFISVLEYSNAQVKCRDHRNNVGTCLPFNKCDRLKTLFSISVLSDNDINSLKAGCPLPLLCCADIGFRSIINNGSPNSLAENKPSNNQLFPGTDSCSPPGIFDKILHGSETKIGEFGWMAIIEYGDEKTLGCGGSLINHRYILTAAHCVIKGVLGRIGLPTRIRLGEHNTDMEIDCIGEECGEKILEVGIEELIPHKDYDKDTGHNDIALIRLTHPVEYTAFIYPVCMPSILNLKKSPAGTNVTVAGWGETLVATRSNIKLKVTLPIYDQNDCSKIYESVIKRKITDKQLCAGRRIGEQKADTCVGDSGGPLMTLIRNQYALEGIISYGVKCLEKEDWPGVYTRVSEYETWIKSHLRE